MAVPVATGSDDMPAMFDGALDKANEVAAGEAAGCAGDCAAADVVFTAADVLDGTSTVAATPGAADTLLVT